MKNKETESDNIFEDDGRTIVDMRGVEKLSLFGNRDRIKEWESIDQEERQSQENRDMRENPSWMKSEMSKEETKYHILGALKAALMIWLVYALSFGGFIWILTRIFKHILK